MKQLSFFAENKEEKLERQVAELKEQCERVRKGQFAKIAALTKLTNELSYQLEILNSAICKERLLIQK